MFWLETNFSFKEKMRNQGQSQKPYSKLLRFNSRFVRKLKPIQARSGSSWRSKDSFRFSKRQRSKSHSNLMELSKSLLMLWMIKFQIKLSTMTSRERQLTSVVMQKWSLKMVHITKVFGKMGLWVDSAKCTSKMVHSTKATGKKISCRETVFVRSRMGTSMKDSGSKEDPTVSSESHLIINFGSTCSF